VIQISFDSIELEGLKIIEQDVLTEISGYYTQAGFAEFLILCEVQILKHVKSLEGRNFGSPLFLANVHSMVGTAGTIGASKVEVIARSLEAACEAANEAAGNDLIARLIAAWGEMAQELKRFAQFSILSPTPSSSKNLPADPMND
jgi:hypothetical protein